MGGGAWGRRPSASFLLPDTWVGTTSKPVAKACRVHDGSFGTFLYYCTVSPPGEDGADYTFLLGVSVLPMEDLAQIPANERRSEERFAGRTWTVYTGSGTRRYITKLDPENLLAATYLGPGPGSFERNAGTAERVVHSIRFKDRLDDDSASL